VSWRHFASGWSRVAAHDGDGSGIAVEESTMEPSSEQTRYPALRIIVFAQYTLGALVAVSGTIAAFQILFRRVEPLFGATPLQGFYISLLVTAAIVTAIVAPAELLRVLVDIERNTRELSTPRSWDDRRESDSRQTGT
jgi:hypothetical protein